MPPFGKNPKGPYPGATTSPQQVRYVANMIEGDKNQRECAELAGLGGSHRASLLMRDPAIVNAIAVGQRKALRKAVLSRAKVLREQSRLAFSDITEVLTITEDQRVIIRPTKEWPKHVSAAVEEVIIHEGPDGGVTTKIKMHKKLTALKQLGEAIGVLEDQKKRLAAYTDEELKAEIARRYPEYRPLLSNESTEYTEPLDDPEPEWHSETTAEEPREDENE